MQKCTSCHAELPEDFFLKPGRPSPKKPLQLQENCVLCRSTKRSHNVYLGKKRNLKFYKDRVFKTYGEVCKCCGETNPKFLTIDHVNGNGAEERKKYGPTSYELYRRIIASGYSDDYQVLCMNCNWGKGMYGRCPHLESKV